MKIFVTSDTHFNHVNIINYCHRPFSGVDEMNAAIEHNWNSIVDEQDTIIHLGDFAMADRKSSFPILERLKGNKILVKGNHDEKSIYQHPAWSEVVDYKEIKLEGYRFVLCHYPFISWKGLQHGSINVHGHCHGMLPRTKQQIDVGVDCFNFTPVELLEIPKILDVYDGHKDPTHPVAR